MRFFFDLSISKHIVGALKVLSAKAGFPEIVHHDERFPPGDDPAKPPDDWDWIQELGREGRWVAIVSDLNISRRLHEQEAWLSSGMTIFFLADGFGNLRFWDQALFLMKRWPKIVAEAMRHPSGAGFEIRMSGDELKPINMQQKRDAVARKMKKHGDLADRKAKLGGGRADGGEGS